MISSKDFENWKADEVTKAFFLACQERLNDCREILLNSAGIDPVDDNFNRGFITAYQEIPQFRIDDMEEVE